MSLIPKTGQTINAQVLRDETSLRANSKTRVYNLFKDLIDSSVFYDQIFQSTGNSLTGIISQNGITNLLSESTTDINILYNKNLDVDDYGAISNGVFDNFSIIQNLIDNNIGKKIIIGKKTSEVYIVSQPLIIPSGSILEINGTLKLKDTTIRSLSTNASIGNTSISVLNADQYFSPGQWIIISDDNKAIQGGGAWMTERVSDGNYVSAVTTNSIVLRTPLISNFSTAANAIVAHGQSVLLLDSINTVKIFGNGIIDNNSNALARLNPTNENGINESVRQMCGISIENCTNIKLDGLKIINTAMHGVVLHDLSEVDITNITCDNIHGKAVLVWGVSNSFINNILMTNCYNEDAFSMYNGNVNLNVSNIRAIGARRYGFALIGADNENVNVDGLTLTANQIDLWVQTGEKINISNVIISGTHANQNVLATISDSDEITINNIIISNSTGSRAISISNASRNIKINNLTVSDMTAAAAITVGSDCPNVFFNGTIVKNVLTAIDLSSGQPTNLRFTEGIFETYTNFILGSSRPKFIKCGGTPTFIAASTATLKNGKTSVNVNHNLTVSPNISNLSVVSTSILGNAKHYWVNHIDDISFGISVDTNPGQDITFKWVINDDYIGDILSEILYTENYFSNFSVTNDGWVGTRLVTSGNTDNVFGENDTLKIYATNVSGTHDLTKAVAVNGSINRVSFKYYIPSGQTNVNGIRVYGNAFTSTILDLPSTKITYNKWVDVSSSEFSATSTSIYFRLLKTFTTSFVGANSPSDDLVYLKDIVVEYR